MNLRPYFENFAPVVRDGVVVGYDITLLVPKSELAEFMREMGLDQGAHQCTQNVNSKLG